MKGSKNRVAPAEANRQFSDSLRRVRGGRTFVFTSHGRPVAKTAPVDAGGEPRARARAAGAACRALDARGVARPHRAMSTAWDTNVLAYAEGTNGAVMKRRTLGPLSRLPLE